MNKALLITLVTIGLLTIYIIYAYTRPGEYDDFAKCLTENNVTFYGTFWCPHCSNQKELFGKSMKYINYVECSTADGKYQKEVCEKAGISGYPTWEFSNGTRLEGEISIKTLSEYSGCQVKTGD